MTKFLPIWSHWDPALQDVPVMNERTNKYIASHVYQASPAQAVSCGQYYNFIIFLKATTRYPGGIGTFDPLPPLQAETIPCRQDDFENTYKCRVGKKLAKIID
jgi:hypothetical protein